MIVQVANCYLQKGSFDRVLDLLKEWESGHLSKIRGFRELKVFRREDDPHGVSCHITFDSAEALDEFSSAQATHDTFAKVQDYVDFGLEYYELREHAGSGTSAG